MVYCTFIQQNFSKQISMNPDNSTDLVQINFNFIKVHKNQLQMSIVFRCHN